MSTHGAHEIRGSRQVPRSPIHEGRFGRMFRRLDPLADPGPDALKALADSMLEAEPPPPGGWGSAPQPQDLDNPAIPAGYTYFGQLVDHDITFDPVSSLTRQNDPDALVDFRSPRFDLDSLYGSGPADEPFQYQRGPGPERLLIGGNDHGDLDLPRNTEGTALIGDPRNDENIIVSQLHLLFLKLHNKLVDQVAAEGALPADQQFAEAQRRTRWLYQKALVEDFLARIVGPDTLAMVLALDDCGLPSPRRRFYVPRSNPYMPIEFSAAAYRFGHSMVRGNYDLSDTVTGRPIFVAGEPDEFADLRGRRRLPQSWTVDWKHFFDLGGSNPQPSRKIDAKLAPGLFSLPGTGDSLALLNLRRGVAMGLPSGQDVAKALGIEPLSADELGGAIEPTPLWFYLLKEAEVRAGGAHLGPTGGRIVAEVLLGLLELDRTSYLSIEPTWTPTIPLAAPPTVTLGDIVTFVNT